MELTNRTWGLLLTLACASATASGQVALDKPLVLTGTDPEQRQVTGLGDPYAADHGVSVDALRSGTMDRLVVENDTWWYALPAGDNANPPAAGARFSAHLVTSNAGPVTITIDGHGPYALLNGALELSAGTLPADSEVSVIFDGVAFQLIGARAIGPKPCPTGMVAISSQHCIDVNESSASFFDGAALSCNRRGAQLCSWGEWYVACVRAEVLGLNAMLGAWEWTNSSANMDGAARVVGRVNCTMSGTASALSGNPYSFRCCYRR